MLKEVSVNRHRQRPFRYAEQNESLYEWDTLENKNNKKFKKREIKKRLKKKREKYLSKEKIFWDSDSLMILKYI